MAVILNLNRMPPRTAGRLYDVQAPTLLLIVGMHRSGTSSVSGLYTILGADIGRSIMGPAEDNPKGFFENTRIVDIHDKLLLALGRTWDVDLDLPEGWLDTPEAETATAELVNILEQEFEANNPVWLVKDPRLCLILDLWKRVADQLGRHLRCVVVVRHPDEIAASLERREAMPFPVVIALQGFYWRSVKRQTAVIGAAGVNYNALMTRKADVLQILNKASGGLFPDPPPELQAEAGEFFTEKLVTHSARGARSPIGATFIETIGTSEPLLSPKTVETFITRSASLPEDLSAENDDIAKRRHAYINRLRFTASRLNLELMRTQAAYAKLQDEADGAKRQAAALEQKLTELGAGFHADVATLKNRAAILEGKLTRAEERRQTAESSERRGEAKLRALEQETTSLRQEYQRIVNQVSSLQDRLAHDARNPFRTSMKHFVRGSARLGFRALPISDRHKQLLVSRYGPAISRYMPGSTLPVQSIENIDTTPIEEPARAAQNIKFADFHSPDVSIIVPVYNQLGYTLRCLDSLATHQTSLRFEVILMDDVSNDKTPEVLPSIPGLRYVRNEANLGFLRNCNKAAGLARGKYLVFLNNDTVVMPGWLDALCDTFREHGNVGLVGSKLVYPDGRLQEAGGIIWNDASGWNWGRLGDPNHPRYNYVRDADYVSGASIIITRELFEKLGRFDERYVPAYYEDTDLAFAVRAAGYRVLYQPKSGVIHFEGISSGRDTNKGVKRYQVVNKRKFLEKWQDVLAGHGRPEDGPERAADRCWSRHVLIVDAVTPTPDQDSGSIDMMNLIKILVSLGRRVHFVPQTNYVHAGYYTDELQKMGVECVYFPPYKTLEHYLNDNADLFDTVILCREPIATHVFKTISKQLPKARVIFYTVDLHYLRTERQAALMNDAEIADDAARTKDAELALIDSCDISILLSEHERDLVARECPHAATSVLPLIREIPGRTLEFADRRDVVFIGSYNHPPNVDAVKWLVEDIWPLVTARDPSIRLKICGSNMPPYIEQICASASGVDAVGFVTELGSLFNFCRLSVAPLRYGAGLKGKLATSYGYGVPCIATPVAVEGMSPEGLTDCRLEGSTAEEIADLILKHYNSETDWVRASDASLSYVTRHFSFDVIRNKVAAILKQLDDKPAA